MPIDNGAMMAQRRNLLMQADHSRAAAWDHIGQAIDVLKAHGAKPNQIMKAIAPTLEPLRKLTISSGRDDGAITGELALLFARPAPKPAAPQQSAPTPVRQQAAAPPAQPDFHLNDIPDAHIDAVIDRAFEGMGV
jgi:hypothetical protein